MASGRHTARSIAKLYLGRIRALDRSGPALRHVLEINPEALAVAEALDDERLAKGPRGPLHGVPLLVKDNIDTADRMQTTAGSLALVGSPAARDACVVEKLRAAGAVILAKTNLSEWANFRSSPSSSGWSARGGQGRNPYALDRSPGGSSSGTGGGVAASYAAAGIGTETDGSIICPSSLNGLVGIKPTVGLVSRAGIIPISHHQDTAGPMARTVHDAAILLGAIAGADPRDPATALSRGRAMSDYAAFLQPGGLKAARIGVARASFFGYNPAADRLIEAALEAMRKEGAVIVDPANIPHVGEYGDSEMTAMLYEFKAGLNSYLASRGPAATVRSLKEIIDFNERNRAREMACFGQELFLKAEAKGPLSEKEYLEAVAKNQRLSRTDGIDAVLSQHNLAAIVAPSFGPAWLIDLVNGDQVAGGSPGPAAVAGYPSITVPAGFVHGLPVGISFIGAAWSETTLLRLAFAFEQTTRHRRPPRFPSTAELRAG